MNYIIKIFRIIRIIFLPITPFYLLIFNLLKKFSKAHKADIPVICVGNITTGGTGKTPSVVFLAQLLKDAGYSPCIVSRGYGGTATDNGMIVSDGHSVTANPAQCGDEPYLIASNLSGIPVAVCNERIKAIRLLQDKFNTDVVVMDDGFQNNSIYKDISIVILDAAKPFGNGMLLPAGDMREPKHSLKRADIIILNRKNAKTQNLKLVHRIGSLTGGKNIFTAHYSGDFLININNNKIEEPISLLKNKRVLLVSALARPESFETAINRQSPALLNHLAYHDHHKFNDKDIARILSLSDKYDFVITTEKDFVKLKEFKLNPKFYYYKIIMMIDNHEIFKQNILKLINNIQMQK